MIRFRTQYDEDYRSEIFAEDPGEDEGLVQQDMRDECDVNVIMRRYQQTGVLTHISAMAAEYGDYSDVCDYREGLDRMMAADAMFMELPSSVRERFRNDPGAFVEFAVDPSNLDEMIKMGLAPERASSEAPKGGARTPSLDDEVVPSKAPKKGVD